MPDHLLAVIERGEAPPCRLLDLAALPLVPGRVVIFLQFFQEQSAQAVLARAVPEPAADARLVAQLQLEEHLAQILPQAAQIRALVGLAGEHDAVHVAHGLVRQGGVDRKEGIGAGHVDAELFVAAQGDVPRLERAALLRERDDADALLPGLVEAPALRAAGPGVPGRAGAQEAAGLVDVAEGGVVDAALGQLLLADGVVGGVGPADLAVQAQEIEHALLPGRAEVLQQRAGVFLGEGRAVDAHAEVPEREALDLVFGEDAHVGGQLEPRLGERGA